jgi:hypothetical protein
MVILDDRGVPGHRVVAAGRALTFYPVAVFSSSLAKNAKFE